MADADGAPQSGWQRYYAILRNHYNRFAALGCSFRMRIAYDGDKLTVSVAPKGTTNYEVLYEDPDFSLQGTEQNPDHLHLQSHWGSGVSFSNIVFQP